MQSDAKTVNAYLEELPVDRREAIQTLRQIVLDNLDERVVETMASGMIGYCVPHSVYPAGYHCNPKQPLPFMNIASQKNHMALYMFCLYTDADDLAWFEKAWAKTGKKLDMGKSCLRFKKLDDLALNVIGQMVKKMTVDKFINSYESALNAPRPTRKKTASKKITKKPTR